MVSVTLTMYAIHLDIFTCFQSYAIRVRPKQKNVSGATNNPPIYFYADSSTPGNHNETCTCPLTGARIHSPWDPCVQTQHSTTPPCSFCYFFRLLLAALESYACSYAYETDEILNVCPCSTCTY